MGLVRLSFGLAFVACLSQSFAQTPTPAASSTAARAAATPARAGAVPAGKGKEEMPKPKFLVKVHLLTTTAVPLQPGSCYSSALHFPATNADAVAKALTPFSDYTLVAVPPDRVAIYYKSDVASPPGLAKIESDMDKLAAADFRYAQAVSVPRGSATRTLTELHLAPDSSITAAAVDEDCILLLSKTETPDPVAIATLSRRLPQIYWRIETTQPTQRLFHLDAAAVTSKLSGASDSASKKISSDGNGANSANSKYAEKAEPSAKSGKSSSKSGAATGKNPAQKNAAVSPATKGAAKSPTNTGDVPDSGNDSEDSPAATASIPDQSHSDNQSDAKKDVPVLAKPLTMRPVNDILVYSNDDGSDKGFFERNRLMAVLDLPRPEVLMNIWSMQVSTSDPKTASLDGESAEELVSHHNDVLENSVEQGWDFLSRNMSNHNFFEPGFYSYVTKKFTETEAYVEAADPGQPGSTSKASYGADQGNKDEAIGADRRKRWGWCDPDQYCLGFIHAFEPVRPTLTNILLTIIAARDSERTAEQTICAMEKPPGKFPPDCPQGQSFPQVSEGSGKPIGPATDKRKVGEFDACVREELKNLNTLRQQSAVDDCELSDRITLLNEISNDQPEGLQLQCFRQQARQSFGPPLGRASEYAATRVGLLRAAVADFLFNYKWATQYPHDFVPYDLTQSAQELNAEFNPLVLAFNRDVKAFTQNLETELACKHDANAAHSGHLAWFRKGDETFLNDGMISVRGISGVESVVDTVTQSYFDATNPPSLTDLVKSVSDAENNVPGVLKTNLSADEAAVLLGALNSVPPAQAKIGRELKLDITPHALAGASSAELEVRLTADETANPTLFKSEKQEEDTLSRVAKHDTSTRVRVESLKLFDVSAFSAMLQRPRSKFPIIPPLFEVPYFGSFVGLPLPGAKVYHRSTAIVSAIIVPTAADLAFGIEFGSDRVCQTADSAAQPFQCHIAHSPRDFGVLPLRNFHKAMVLCFASRGKTFYPGKLLEEFGETTGRESIEAGIMKPEENLCANLSLVQTDFTQRKIDKSKSDVAVPPN